MKKIIIAVIVVVAVLASPMLFGVLARSTLDADVKRVNDIPGYKAEIVEYKSGYQKAIAKIRVGYDIDPAALQGIPAESRFIFEALSQGLEIDVDITHGPVIFSPNFKLGSMYVTGELNKDNDYIQQALSALDVDYLLKYEMSMGYFGSGTGVFSVPSFSIVEGADQFQFGGIHINADIADFGKSSVVDGRIEEIAIRSEDVNATIAPATITGQSKLGESYLDTTGEYTMTFPSVAVNGIESGQVNDIVLHVNTREAGENKLGVDYDINVKRIEGFSLDRTLSDMQFSLTMDNLDKEAMMALTKMSTDITALESGEEEVIKVMSDLLRGSPRMKINNIGFTVNDSAKMNVSGEFSVDGDKLSDPVDFSNPGLLVPAVMASLNASVDQTLVAEAIALYSAQQVASLATQMQLTPEEQQQMLQQQSSQFEQMLDNFLQQGLVEKNGNSYVVKASFQNGQLMVNGNPLRL